jgi:glycosidase
VVGEVKDGDVVHTSFFQGGRVRFDWVDSGLDSLLDFPLFYPIRHAFAEGKPIDEIPKTLAKDYLYTNPKLLVTLLGGHDDGRFMSEKGATIAGLKLANAFILTARGVPQLYYGDELAMEGEDEPTTRGDFPGGFPGDKRNAFTAAGRTKEEQELFEYIRRLTALRRELKPLQVGVFINLYASEQQYAYARTTGPNTVIVVFNNDNNAAEFEFDVDRLGFKADAIMHDRLGVIRDVALRDYRLRLSLPKRSVAILVSR